MTTNMVSRQVHLASRPRGAATLDNFEVVDVALPEPGEGQIVVRNEYMSVEPYMRGRMNDIAKLRGAKRVIGSAGTDEKIYYLVNTLTHQRQHPRSEGRATEGRLRRSRREVEAAQDEGSGGTQRPDPSPGAKRKAGAFVGLMDGTNVGKTLVHVGGSS